MRFSLKRILLFFLFVAVTFVQTGCKPGEKKNNNNGTPQITPYPTQEPYELKEGSAAEFAVAGVFSNDMIIQRDQEIAIYGTAPESENGKIVAAELKGIMGSAEIKDGKWKIIMQGTLPASKEMGHSLIVRGAQGVEVIFEDVLIGDVWYVGGQSNADMVFVPAAVTLYKDDLDKITKDTIIRVFHQLNFDLNNNKDKEAVLEPQDNPLKRYKWKVATKAIVQSSSMMGFFFAQTLTELNPDVPVGYINVACGGASLSMLSPKNVVETFPADMQNKVLDLGVVKIPDSGIYNAFIHPFLDFGIRGMIFYQGESDAASSKSYGNALKTYIQDLRDKFGEHFLFLNVQLTSYGYYAGTIQLAGIWDLVNDMRDAQADIKITNLIYNYEVVATYDVGWRTGDADGAHPTYKKPIGERLGKIAASLVYGIGDIENVACPVPEKVEFASDKVVVEFRYTGGGLKLKAGDVLNGFEVKVNGLWELCDAVIEGDKVIVNKAGVTGIRYANKLRIFEDTEANLVSGTDFPAVSFTVLK